MKKIMMALAAFLVTTPLLAGGVLENTNNSAEWSRMGNRNASTSIDAVFFNPAGTALLKDGLHVMGSAQLISQTRTSSNDMVVVPAQQDEYVGETLAPFPNFAIAYKTGDLTISAGFLPVGGGGSATFDDGLPSYHLQFVNILGTMLATNHLSTSDISVLTQKFEGSSMYLAGRLNGAYKINKMISIGVGAQYYQATDKGTGEFHVVVPAAHMDNTIKVDYEETGSAYGFLGGVNIMPMDGLNIAITFTWNSELKMTRETKEDGTAAFITGGMFPDDKEIYNTLPMKLAIGISYNITPELRVEPNFTYYFNKNVEWTKYSVLGTQDKIKASDAYDNGFDVGIGFEYKVMPTLVTSVGWFYTKNGAKTDGTYMGVDDKASGINSHTILAGVTYTVIPDLDVTVAGYTTLYEETSFTQPYGTTYKTTIDKDLWAVALGVSYRYGK